MKVLSDCALNFQHKRYFLGHSSAASPAGGPSPQGCQLQDSLCTKGCWSCICCLDVLCMMAAQYWHVTASARMGLTRQLLSRAAP